MLTSMPNVVAAVMMYRRPQEVKPWNSRTMLGRAATSGEMAEVRHGAADDRAPDRRPIPRTPRRARRSWRSVREVCEGAAARDADARSVW
jgi:hypothetical protein